MKTLIKNGRVATAVDDYQADIFIDGETVSTIGRTLDMEADVVIDASGKLVIPGGIDPHTHILKEVSPQIRMHQNRKCFPFILRFGLLLIGTLVLATVAFSQTGPSDADVIRSAKALLDETVGENGPGVALLIARKDRVVLRTARGRANIELDVALTPDNVFRIASITKMFTAATITKLAENGKLSIDDRIDKFFPDFPKGDLITIRQLLTHTAGISDRPSPQSVPRPRPQDIETAERVLEISRRVLEFAPGTSQSYSNAGYILLGAIIEKVTGKKWHEAMNDEIFVPLGLSNTAYGDGSKIVPGRAEGYTTNTEGHVVRNVQYISAATPAAAGGLISTIDDLNKWLRALFGGKVVRPDPLEVMMTPPHLPGGPVRNPYGFGMYVWGVRGERMFGHTGQIPGFTSVAAYLPKNSITIVAIGNDDNFDAQNFGRRLAAITIGRPYVRVRPVPVGAADLISIPGRYQDTGEVRTFIAKDGKLYSQRPNRNPSLLQLTAKGEMHFVPDELTYMVAVRDDSGNVVGIEYYDHGEGPPRLLKRID